VPSSLDLSLPALRGSPKQNLVTAVHSVPPDGFAGGPAV
jgi:hypothetical protein